MTELTIEDLATAKEIEHNYSKNDLDIQFQKQTGTKPNDQDYTQKMYAWHMNKLNNETKQNNLDHQRKVMLSQLTITNYLDNVRAFHKDNPFFYDKNKIFWMWNKKQYSYEMVDETDLLIKIEGELTMNGLTVTTKMKNNYLEAFRRVGREKLPKQPEKNWIQFKNKVIDLSSEQTYEVSPTYFFCNPIPWKLGDTTDTPTFDKLFTEWVGEHKKEVLYEIIAYTCLTDYPIHTLFALIGSGRNGKTKFLQIITKFTGIKNCTSTELDDLLERPFERGKLFKKLVCIMGETNFATINKSSVLKRLTGQDLMSFEFKGKNPFDEYNFAKIIIASNSLPSSLDTSEGFYRRWLIINFPNSFEEGHDILNIIPEIEYENLALKSITKLKQVLSRGSFTGQGSIEDRKHAYIMASNPLVFFLQECCEHHEDYFIKSKDLYAAFTKYLIRNKKRIVRRKEFNQVLSEEGFYPEKTGKQLSDGSWENTFWVSGLRLKKSLDVLEDLDYIPTSSTYKKEEVRSISNLSNFSRENEDLCLTSFETLQSLLLDKAGQEINIDTLISYGFTETQLQNWKNEGLIFEPKNGVVRLI